MSRVRLAAIAALGLLAVGAEAQQSCAASGDVSYVCGPKNPEDLVLVPGTQWIVSSGMAEGAGFYLVDSRSGDFSSLTFMAQHDHTFASCATPPSAQALNTHGLNIRATGPGRARLNVVGHGAREAIEVFDVDASGARPTLTWRGCVPMPEGLAANSVASFADGSLVATVLFMPGTTFADAIVARKPTGAVFEWSPGKPGFELVRGTELPANNGIEVSADGREIYVASSGLQTIVAFSHSNPARQLAHDAAAAVHARQRALGSGRPFGDCRYGQRRARMRRPARARARHREARRSARARRSRWRSIRRRCAIRSSRGRPRRRASATRRWSCPSAVKRGSARSRAIVSRAHRCAEGAAKGATRGQCVIE